MTPKIFIFIVLREKHEKKEVGRALPAERTRLRGATAQIHCALVRANNRQKTRAFFPTEC
jgi:hypothetical protein